MQFFLENLLINFCSVHARNGDDNTFECSHFDKYSRDCNECLYSSEIKTFSSSLKYTAFSNPAAIGSLYEDENLRDLMKNAILPTATIINRSPITTPVIANTTLGLSVKDDIYYIKTQFCQFYQKTSIF